MDLFMDIIIMRNFMENTFGDAKERTRLDDQSSETYGVTLGGSIIKNKLFFFHQL